MQSMSSGRKRNDRRSQMKPQKSHEREPLKDSPAVLAGTAGHVGGLPPLAPPALTGSRVSRRLKTAKIPFDPSDFNDRRQLSFKTAPLQQKFCCHCKKTDKQEVLIDCKGSCDIKIHLTCLLSTCNRFGKDEELTWQCYSCQTCKICNKNDIDDDTVLKCYVCFSYYHVKCHGNEDKIEIVKKNRFACRSCITAKVQKLTPAIDTNSYTPRTTRAQTRSKSVSFENNCSNDFHGFSANEFEKNSSADDENAGQKNIKYHCAGCKPSTSTENRSSVSNENRCSIYDETIIPDATEWSVEQVFQYFHEKFPEYALVFKHQEIDGPSLYLLKRLDVLKGFNIKIGPALKIYEHILKLQTKCSDPTLSWQ